MSIESLKDRLPDYARDLGGIEIGAVAQTDDVPLAFVEFGKRSEQCLARPSAVDVAFDVGTVVRDLL